MSGSVHHHPCPPPHHNRHMSREDLARQVKNRRKIVLNGRDSGFSNIPDPLPGTVGNLLKPASGMIEDMQAIDAPGVRRIIAETGKTAPDKPLFICVGGPLTAVASAWLMDNSIADNIIVASIFQSINESEERVSECFISRFSESVHEWF